MPPSKKAPASSPSAETKLTPTAIQRRGVSPSPAKSGVKEAAAIEAAGGGPEDPVADVAAAGSLLSGLKAGAKKAPAPGQAFAASNTARWVLVEFLVCFVVLGLGTIVAPDGKKNGGAAHLAVKGSALALLFFILGLMSGGGHKAAKTAGALGGLVTAAYVFTSQDSANLVAWIGKFFASSNSAAAQAGAGVGSVASAAASAGSGIGSVAGAAAQ